MTTNNKLYCNDFKIRKLLEENCKTSNFFFWSITQYIQKKINIKFCQI